MSVTVLDLMGNTVNPLQAGPKLEGGCCCSGSPVEELGSPAWWDSGIAKLVRCGSKQP